MWRWLRSLALGIGFCVAGTALGLVCAEGMLTLARAPKGWKYMSRWGIDDMAARYVPKPGWRGIDDGMSFRFNSRGLRGAELSRADVLLMGDSCTFGVGVPEEKTFAGLLAARGYAVANAGVPGYNSTCGLARLRTSGLLSLKPRAVVIYFGWNDHWRAAAPESFFAHLRPLAARWRVAALLLRFQQSLFRADSAFGRLRIIPQVPLGEFKENLVAMIELSRAHGAQPILITPATDPRQWAPRIIYYRDYLTYHARYVEAVRQVAAQTHTPLLDFAAQAARLDPATRDDDFQDPIHLSPAGHRLLAGELFTMLESLGIRPVSGSAPRSSS